MLGALDRAAVRSSIAHRIAVTASIGFRHLPDRAGPRCMCPGKRAIDLVDTAMYLAKAHGRKSRLRRAAPAGA